MGASHHPREFPLPVYFRHPKTGLVIEVDTDGVTTADGRRFGPLRTWASMKMGHETNHSWSPEAEIEVLTHHHWQRF